MSGGGRWRRAREQNRGSGGGEGVAGAERKVVRKREEPEVKSRDMSGKR